MSYENLLNILVTVRSKTNSQSTSGAVNFTWTDKATGVKSRRVRNNQPKIYDDIAKTYIDAYKFYFLIGASIEVADRIELADGREYEILSVDKDSSEHHIKAYAKITKN
jgi:hypothetical protein